MSAAGIIDVFEWFCVYATDPVEIFQVATIRDDLAMELASAQVILKNKKNNVAGKNLIDDLEIHILSPTGRRVFESTVWQIPVNQHYR